MKYLIAILSFIFISASFAQQSSPTARDLQRARDAGTTAPVFQPRPIQEKPKLPPRVRVEESVCEKTVPPKCYTKVKYIVIYK